MPDATLSTNEPEQVPTNLRLVRLIEEIARAGVPLAPPAIQQALGLPKPTVHRLLQTAEAEGLVQRHLDGKSYGPGQRLRRISLNTLSSERMRTERLAILRNLGDIVGETINVAMPDHDGMLYLDRVETSWPLRIQMPVGSRVPLHCSASGKMYLSSLRTDKLDRLLSVLNLEALTARSLTERDALQRELTDIRIRGFATDNEEFMDGMCALAVPIRDDQDRLVCTLSIHAPSQRAPVDVLTTHLDLLKQTAARLEALIID